MVKKMVRPRSAIAPEIEDPEFMPGGPELAKDYVGVRYRVGLNKYVTEIRPTKSAKKIWLGTYDTAEEAARAFDIGNLCCKKNLPLNFADSPRLLRRISSRLSPDEAHNAIAKLAKDVARVVTNVGSDNAAAKKAHRLVEQRAPNIDSPAELLHQQELEHAKSESRTHHRELDGAAAVTYTEEAPETHHVVAVMEEIDMPLNASGDHPVRKLNFEHHIVAAKEELDMPLNAAGHRSVRKFYSEPRAQLHQSDCTAAITYTEETPETHHVVVVKEELAMPLNAGGEHSVRKLNTEHHVVAAKEELDLVATSMPLNVDGEGGSGGRGWSFDMTQLTQLFFDDERADIPLHKLINFGPDQQQPKLYGEVL